MRWGKRGKTRIQRWQQLWWRGPPAAPTVQTGRAQEAACALLHVVRFHTYSLLFLVIATLSLK